MRLSSRDNQGWESRTPSGRCLWGAYRSSLDDGEATEHQPPSRPSTLARTSSAVRVIILLGVPAGSIADGFRRAEGSLSKWRA